MSTKGKTQVVANGDREVVVTREFNAPRTLVYEAITKPELVKRWLGKRNGWTMPVCEMDLRVGGKYRWVWRGPNDVEMGMGGVYREIVPNERIVSTEKFDQSWYPGEALDTVALVERGGKTTMTTTVQYESKAARDAVLQTPMADGMAEGYDVLDTVLAECASGVS